MSKIKMTVDGNTAAAYISYAFTDVAAIYPITPSSNMAESVDEWSAKGKKNIFGQKVRVVEMQSEAGAAGALHGSLQAGALTTTFTASQGLLLMIPNMYKVAGELLPAVFHVSARAIATHALSIFGDHQDVMAARQTGVVMLASGSVQEIMDLAPVAHLAAIKGRLPFLHFFDGFRTSHEVQKVEALEYEDLASLVDYQAVNEFRNRALSPNHPVTRGTAQNPDVYFQGREASNPFYNDIVGIVEDYMNKVGALTGRKHGLFDYYGAPDAENIIVAMGSITDVVEETIDYMNSQGKKYGLVKVHLYRPFSVQHLMNAIPKTVKKIAVLDRTKEPGSVGEPLYLDVKAAFYDVPNAPIIVGGRFGLASKDTTPSDIKAVYDNLEQQNPKNQFTIGIDDDVTHTSLAANEKINAEPNSTIRCKFWGLGSDGTVGANKQAIKIIGDHTEKYAQGYFAYDSKKSGGVTMSHLRFGNERIKSAYLINEADYIACHNQSYVNQYDLLKGIKKGGIFVLNCLWDEKELEDHLPAEIKRQISRNNIQFYTVDATKIAESIGLGNRINMIMQAAFFKLANIIPLDDAVKYLKEAVVKSYGNKGENIVKVNHEAIDKGIDAIVKINVPDSWKDAQDTSNTDIKEPAFISEIMRPMNAMKGEDLPVSAFKGIEDGTLPNGTSAYEKRGIAVNVPEWIPETCIQCNICSLVCPHAVIRPTLATEEELKDAPETFVTKKAVGKGLEEYQFRIQISPMDCTGCGNCADVCPAKPKALVMKKLSTQTEQEIPNFDFAIKKIGYKGGNFGNKTIKDSQFRKPLMEFSGACAGCGETPYIKLITQLYGDRMMIANATGCSSIWAASYPTSSYTVNHEGKGPSWANSLFEDNAEFGYGMYLGVKQIRERLRDVALELLELDINENLRPLLSKWLESVEEGADSKGASEDLIRALQSYSNNDQKQMQLVNELIEKKDYLIKRSIWVVGGDGWAYDIGYGGVDHVLSTGDDINMLVFDTEIYSNTGGQASKATPTSAIAKFASSGKKQAKKDLAAQMMTYGNVYVAQVGIGADRNQMLKAIAEAEAYNGPSIIIAYSPCISHGIKDGMGRSIANSAAAVSAGYWHLFRYNPDLKKEGKNPFILDSKEPKESFKEFLMSQVRYSSLAKMFPEEAEELFTLAEEHAKEKYMRLKRMAEQ